MDKNDYREKTEQLLACIKEKKYREAVELADTIDWDKVKNVSVLCAASEIYEYNREYDKSRNLLMNAYERSPESRKIVYRLASLALKLGDVQEATECYEEFVQMAPKDPNQYILRYKILRTKGAPVEQQIETLEDFKKVEYVEKWAFELAQLYDEAGMTAECLEECDDLILWFSEGKFVQKAMELKMQYKPLTPLQQEKYMQKYAPKTEEVVTEDVPEEAVVEEQKEEELALEETVVEETVVEETVEEAVEPTTEKAVEPATEEAAPEEFKEELEEMKEDLDDEREVEEALTVEQKSPTSGLSIEEILQNWEEKQKENAQMIQAQQEKAQKEQEELGIGEKEEESSILPDDIRQLMEELEEESNAGAAKRVIPVKTEPVKSVEPETAEEEIIEEPETVSGIKVGDTQQIMNVAKALLNDTVAEMPVMETPEIEEKTTNSRYDTGFVVQGRYDLDAQSAVGLKAGLTEEQKKLFSYFVPVHGMSEQIVEVLERDKQCRARYGTSRTGNVIVVGRKGSGKTVLAVNIVKAIQKARKSKQGKLAIVTAEALNKKDLTQIIEKLYGGAIVIEQASQLSKRTITHLSALMEEQTGELLVVLEDERKMIDKMLAANPRFAKKFTSRVELPVFINDELVTFGQTYAKENGYTIDEMGILALYTHIDVMQRDESAVTVAAVKELIDQAIEHSQKMNVKHLVRKVFKKETDESARVILSEEDFKW